MLGFAVALAVVLALALMAAASRFSPRLPTRAPSPVGSGGDDRAKEQEARTLMVGPPA